MVSVAEWFRRKFVALVLRQFDPVPTPPPYCNMRWTVEPCKQYNPVLDVGFRARGSERLRENSPTGCIP